MRALLLFILLFVEKIFWTASAILMAIAAFGMLWVGGVKLITNFTQPQLSIVLTKYFFYSIICFELFQISRVRIEGQSHKIVLYHFIVMAALTFGREIFLIHNLSLHVVAGFSVLVGVFMVFYMWRERSRDVCLAREEEKPPVPEEKLSPANSNQTLDGKQDILQ